MGTDSSDEYEQVTAAMPKWMVEAVDSQLKYGDSRSAFVREAIRQRLDDQGRLDDSDDANDSSEGEA